jgi:hypothetical protein
MVQPLLASESFMVRSECAHQPQVRALPQALGDDLASLKTGAAQEQTVRLCTSAAVTPGARSRRLPGQDNGPRISTQGDLIDEH